MHHKHTPHKETTTDKVLLGSIVVSMFLWGLSWPSGKALTHYCTPINFGVYRYIFVVITLLLILLVAKVPIKVKKQGIPFILASGALLAIYSFFFVLGLTKGTAGAGGVLVTTLNPLVSYALGIVIKRKLPSRNDTLGLTIGAIAGCVLLKLWDSSALMDSGNIFFLLAACTWATMSVFTSKGAKYGSSMSFSFWQYVITLVCMIPLMNFTEARTAIHITDFKFWGNLFFGASIVTALATTMFFYATTQVGAEKASSYIFMVPLAAAVSSWLILGEYILPHTIVGGTLGIVAVYIINKKKPIPLSSGEPD